MSTLSGFPGSGIGAFLSSPLGARTALADDGTAAQLTTDLIIAGIGSVRVYNPAMIHDMADSLQFQSLPAETLVVRFTLAADQDIQWIAGITSGTPAFRIHAAARAVLYTNSDIMPTQLITRVSDKVVTVDVTPQVSGKEARVIGTLRDIVSFTHNTGTKIAETAAGDQVDPEGGVNGVIRSGSHAVSGLTFDDTTFWDRRGQYTSGEKSSSFMAPFGQATNTFEGGNWHYRISVNGTPTDVVGPTTFTNPAVYRQKVHDVHVSGMSSRPQFSKLIITITGPVAGETLTLSPDFPATTPTCSFTDVTGLTTDFAVGFASAYNTCAAVNNPDSWFGGSSAVAVGSTVEITWRYGYGIGDILIANNSFTLDSWFSLSLDPIEPNDPGVDGSYNESLWRYKETGIEFEIYYKGVSLTSGMQALVTYPSDTSLINGLDYYDAGGGIWVAAAWDEDGAAGYSDLGLEILTTDTTTPTEQFMVYFKRADNIKAAP